MAQDSVRLDFMTSPQINEAIKSGYDTVLMAVGSTEQHGPHLPLGTDALLGDAIAEELAQCLGKTLVAPTVRVGVSEHHMTFAGSMTLCEEVLEEVLVDCCRSLARHGFRNIVLIPTHGGNVTTVDRTVERLMRESISAKVHAHAGREINLAAMVEVGGKYGVTPGEVGGHAGHFETSVMLEQYPNLVDMKKATRGNVELGSDLEEKLHTLGMQRFSPVGILGDATKSSVEAGKDYFEFIISGAVEEIRSALSENDN
jgi:creatinine amidohydrolase